MNRVCKVKRVISGFRLVVDENCLHLDYYGRLAVITYGRFKTTCQCVSRNVCNELALLAK